MKLTSWSFTKPGGVELGTTEANLSRVGEPGTFHYKSSALTTIDLVRNLVLLIHTLTKESVATSKVAYYLNKERDSLQNEMFYLRRNIQ